MVFSNNLLMGAAGQATGFEIDQSIRFNDVDSAFLARTPDASNRKTWTWSAWVKRANLFNGSVPQILLSAGDGGNNDFVVQFGQSDDTLRISDYIGGTASNLIPTQLFRDVGAWYHFVLAYDTTQGTAANRIKLYLNGSQVTAFGTEVYPSQNTDMVINSAIPHNIGRGAYSSNGYFSGYMAEINFVDGTALAPTAFGETNDDGVWIPIKYAGSYGTEGYFIDGRDSSDLGDDESGNGNDFTSSGLAAADQMLDTPTDNYCVLSPIDKSSAITTSDGNLVVTNASTNSWNHGRGTLFAPSGKWYYEWIPTAGSYALAGWMLNVSGNDYVEEESDVATTFYRGVGASGHGFVIGSGSTDSSVTNFALDDVIMMAIDVDSMKMWVGINGTWYNSGDPAGDSNPVGTWTDAIGQSVAPWYGCFNGTTESFNFGQRPFAHTIPTGFNSWNTANLPTPTIADGSEYFQTALYTGRTTAFDVTFDGNSDLAPDWLWFKARSAASNNFLFDKVRGALQKIESDRTAAEATSTGSMTAFGTDGFSLGDGGSANDINGVAGTTYAAWSWAANGSGSSNTDGSLSSTVSANQTAGFSIVTATPGTSGNDTIGHGLGIAPKMIIAKNTNFADNWHVYHSAISPATEVRLNTTSAATTTSWQSATTSSVFQIKNGNWTNGGQVCLFYCFAEIPSYSSIGSFVGNGSTDGPFVYTGFKPKWIMYKRTSGGTGNWDILDTDRDPINAADAVLSADTSTAETTYSDIKIDMLSNGYKIRGTQTNLNASGSSYIYMAFAENPFGGDGAAPATAR